MSRDVVHLLATNHRSLNLGPEEGGRAPAAGEGQSGAPADKNSFETKLDFRVGFGEACVVRWRAGLLLPILRENGEKKGSICRSSPRDIKGKTC